MRWIVRLLLAALLQAEDGVQGKLLKNASYIYYFAILKDTLTDFIRKNTFIACAVVCCNNKKVGRSNLQPRCNIVGDIPYECGNWHTI